MSFSAPIFLWFFMPLVLLSYWILPRHWRNGLIALASLVFYTYGAGPFVFLLLSCIVVNFAAGILVDDPGRSDKPRQRRAILLSAIVFDVGVLAIWKYAGFASRQFNALSEVLGTGSSGVVSVALPIGISFFTFHHLSYVVDVYRHSRPAQKSPVQFVMYIAMFPQLIAGPIVRYHEIAEQLSDTNRDRFDDFALGFPRFALGLVKKVVVADSISPLADAAFATHPGDLTTYAAWLGALAYTVQIYFDFSGYSDMAIGLAQMFGLRLPENFNRPYSAHSITDFWRRWHMSLSRWFRDYVYIPLGGNRHGAARTYRNLIIVFALTGFWHGAAWTFLLWGLYHGFWLVVERLTGWDRREFGAVELVARRALTLLIVIVGWVLFRAGSLSYALSYLGRMFTLHTGPLADGIYIDWTHQRMVMLAIGLLVVFLPEGYVTGRLIERRHAVWPGVARWGVVLVATPYAVILAAAGTFSPFLYFQF